MWWVWFPNAYLGPYLGPESFSIQIRCDFFWFFLLKEPIIEQKMQDQGPQIGAPNMTNLKFNIPLFTGKKINVVAILVQILHFPKCVQVKIVYTPRQILLKMRLMVYFLLIFAILAHIRQHLGNICWLNVDPMLLFKFFQKYRYFFIFVSCLYRQNSWRPLEYSFDSI